MTAAGIGGSGKARITRRRRGAEIAEAGVGEATAKTQEERQREV